MQIPTSSLVLKDKYPKSIVPLLQGFPEMLLAFHPFLEAIILAPFGLFLVEELDPHRTYVLYGFKGSIQQMIQFDSYFHYHQYFLSNRFFLQIRDFLCQKT